jgi:hypothetical protein
MTATSGNRSGHSMAGCVASAKPSASAASRDPRSGEVHHGFGRLGVLRHEIRAALLLCATCHELLTGKVAEKWIIVPTKGSTYFVIREKGTPRELLNLRSKIAFERVA